MLWTLAGNWHRDCPHAWNTNFNALANNTS
jgi:hypothetical protein